MRVLYAGASLLIISLSMALGLGNAPVAAAYKPQVLISHVQVRSVDSASHEAVTISNNSEYVADITNWCLHYTAAGTDITLPASGLSKVFCFDGFNSDETLLLDGYGSVTIFSKNYLEFKLLEGQVSDSFLQFNRALSDSSGHLYLFNADYVEQDRVGWGNASYPAGEPASASPSGSILKRLSQPGGLYQNTNVNLIDFEVVEGNLYDTWTLNDLSIALDLCVSVPGVQFEIPEGYMVDDGDVCRLTDLDDNLDENSQDTETVDGDPGLADNHDRVDEVVAEEAGDESTELLVVEGIIINEILANPAGVDGGNEFVELYNSNTFAVDISGYTLRAGVDGGAYNYYQFPSNSIMEPSGFLVVYSKDFNFNLVNKAGQVVLLAGSDAVSTSDVYFSAPDNQSWSLIDDNWVYTKTLTPGSPNIMHQTEAEQTNSSVDEPKPCATNQYRHPDTNRCRLIAPTSSRTLVQCKDGQERNPETNRCRSVVLAQSTLSPCREGQERNPETNRCRQVLSASIPSAEYPVEPISETEPVGWGWALVVVIGVMAIGYGLWEWRKSIGKLFAQLWLRVRTLRQ